MGRTRRLSKGETYDYLVKQIAPTKSQYNKQLGSNIYVADTSAIYDLPKAKRDAMVKAKARDLGIRF